MIRKIKLPVVLVATSISAFTTPFLGSSVNVALPAIASDFSMSALGLSWVASSFIMAAAIMLLPLGRLADLHGRKRFFFWGSIIVGVSSLACNFAPNEAVFIALRVVQGAGSAMIFSTGTAMLISAYPPHRRGMVLGINVAAVYVGLTVGPFIGGMIVEHLGWRAIFEINALLGAAAAGLCFFMDREKQMPQNGEYFDLPGSFLYALALFSVMYGFSTLPRLTGAVLVACGVVCFFFFVRRQLGMDFPLIDVRLFSDNRVFGMSNLATLIHYCATFAVTFLMSLYLQHVKLLSPSHTGFILVMAPVLQALFSPFAGWLSDHREPRIIASTGMALSAAGLTGLAFISASTHIGLILLWLAMLGVGFALFSSPNVNAVMSSVETKLYGIASATLATMRLVGQMLSMGIAMLIFSCVIGDQPLGHANSDLLVLSAKIILSIMAVTCVAGVFASLARGRVHDGRAAS